MHNFPFGYVPIEPSTWAYLSSLLMLALFFKFNRFWSFRNLDLILLILLAPGLLMVHYGSTLGGDDEVSSAAVKADPSNGTPPAQPESVETGGSNGIPGEVPVANDEDAGSESPTETGGSPYRALERSGYIWLFVIGFVWIVRLLYDPTIARKPVLEPNLSIGGLVFLMCSLLVFLFANIVASQPADLSGPQGAANLFSRTETDASEQLAEVGPGYPLLNIIPALPLFVESDKLEERDFNLMVEIAKIMAILTQIAIIAGLIYVGKVHFGSFQMGAGMATIFLILPYTAQYSGDSMHLLPGALLIWAIACYQKPIVAGILVGLAAGVCYYPLFLLPLWISFYWLRGRRRFTLAALGAIVVVVSTLAFTSADLAGFLAQVKSIFGFIIPRHDGLGGIWALGWNSWFRLPFLAAFVVLCVSYIFWPAQKDLGALISCSAAAMVAVQFWHGAGGGLYMAWYLPLVLLTSFRPNLDDKVAIDMLEDKGNDSVYGDELDS